MRRLLWIASAVAVLSGCSPVEGAAVGTLDIAGGPPGVANVGVPVTIVVKVPNHSDMVPSARSGESIRIPLAPGDYLIDGEIGGNARPCQPVNVHVRAGLAASFNVQCAIH